MQGTDVDMARRCSGTVRAKKDDRQDPVRTNTKTIKVLDDAIYSWCARRVSHHPVALVLQLFFEPALCVMRDIHLVYLPFFFFAVLDVCRLSRLGTAARGKADTLRRTKL